MLPALMSGRLVGDPVVKAGSNGKGYTLARIAAATDGGAALISVIAIASEARCAIERLRKGDDVCLVGRAKLSAWSDKTSGEPRAGVSVVAEHVLSAYALRQRRGKGAEEEPRATEHVSSSR